MAEYPNEHVFIMKVKYLTFLAFLMNQDKSRVKFFHSDEIIPTSQIKQYVKEHYGKEPEWIRCMGSSNPFAKPHHVSLRTSMWSGYTPGYEEISIRHEISSKVGNKPSTDPSDYDSVHDEDLSWRREQKAREKRMRDRLAEYEARASQYPSFSRPLSVTDEEICEVMEWFSSNDKDSPSYNFGSVLDF